MALFGSGGHGLSLKALLEDPNLQNPSKLNSGLPDLKKGGNHHGTYVSNANSAFLGPNLWEKQGDNSNDLDLEYMDLDEFLSENGIPVSTEDANDMQTISLLANALTNSPAHSPNSGIPIRINPSSPDSRSSLLSPKAESPHGINLGVFMPESPIRRSVSPLSYQTGSPPSSQSAIERCLLDDTFGVKLDLPEEESPSWETAESPAATEVDFEVNESDLALVTIPVIRQERSEGMVYSNEQCEQWDSDNSNDFDENMIQNNIPDLRSRYDGSRNEEPSDYGQDNFDPKRRRFTEEELKPQPIIKKSKKVFVDEGKKDDRYWTRRNKNNVAAKRSRDARRVKENQIAMRASFLEAENEKLKKEFQRVQKDNEKLITRLSKYETV